jgi:hypothetical protein
VFLASQSFLPPLVVLPVSLPVFDGKNRSIKGHAMKSQLEQDVRTSTIAFSIVTAFAGLVLCAAPVVAQNPAVQARLAEIKQASAANKEALSHYTWQESQTISIKGEVKKQQQYLVRVGPDGQQQKSEINAQPAGQPSGGRLKQHIVAKKTAEFKDYGEQIADLARQYTQPDPGRLQQALQQGNVSLQLGGDESQVTLTIKNYIKPNDSLTLVFNKQQKAIQSIRVATYLDDPKDAVTIAAQFAKLPNGINHVSGTQIDGASKQLKVVTQNSNYLPT